MRLTQSRCVGIVILAIMLVAPILMLFVSNDSVQSAPVAKTSHLPLITRPLTTATLTTLVNHDCGSVVAATDGAGRIFIGYQDRTQGSKYFFAEDMGTHIVPLPDPDGLIEQLVLGMTPTEPSPSFAFPGEKQGPSFILIVNNVMHIYAVSRDEGDPTGPFKVKRLSMPIPPRPKP